MPVIPRSAPKPLPPEGPAKLHIKEVTYGKSKEKKTPFFGFTLLDLASGLTFNDKVYLTAGSAWRVENFCKSAGLTLPNGNYRLQTDDCDGRIVFGPIAYEAQQDGRQFAKMKSFWRKEYAITQEPKLALIPDPPGAVTAEVTLPIVEETPATTPEPEPAPAAASSQPSMKEPPPPVDSTKVAAQEDPDEVSDEDLKEAFEYAKILKQKKAAKGGKQ